MKKFLLVLGGLLVLVIAAAVIAPFVVPVETYKAEIEKRVLAATGRKLTIAGPVSFSLLPSLAISARDVSFANAPGAGNPNMALLDRLEVRLKLWPLLSGEVAIDSFLLDKASLNLETDRQGRGNWQFDKAPAPQARGQTPAPAQAGGRDNPLSELRLGDVRLANGRVSYRDGQSGKVYEADAVNLRLSLPDLDHPLQIDGGLTWNGKPITLGGQIAAPRALLDGKASAVTLGVGSDLLKLTFKGNAANAQPAKIDGDIDLSVTNLRALAAWLGQPLDVSGTGLGPLAIKGKLAAVMNQQGPRVSFNDAELSLDAIRAKGSVMADLAGRVPYVKASLATNVLNLNPYLPSPTGATASAPRVPGNAPSTGAADIAEQGWSTEPLDFSGLRAANADLALKVDGLLIRDIKIGEGSLAIALKDGKLAADLTELALYQGHGQGRVTLDGAAPVPAVGLTLKLAGVQAEPLLKDSIGLDRLRGQAGADMQISGAGRSQRELVAALAGKGAFKFENGAIKGVNLASLVRNVSTAFLDAQAGRAQETDFSELSGSFTMDKGVMRNNDLSLLAPLLRVGGTGTVDLPRRYVSYKVTPQIAGTLEGQGGQAQTGGVMVPVLIDGPWDALSYKPDLTALLKDPKGALKNLRGVLGNGQQAPAANGGAATPPANPVDQLRGLFGR